MSLPPGYAASIAMRVALWAERDREKAEAAEAAKREAAAESARRIAELIATQEPLGREFERVLYDNLSDLYVRSESGCDAIDSQRREDKGRDGEGIRQREG